MVCSDAECNRLATHLNERDELACLGHAQIRRANDGTPWAVLSDTYGVQCAIGFQWLKDNPNPKRKARKS